MPTLQEIRDRIWKAYDDQPIILVAPTIMLGAALFLFYRRRMLIPLEAVQESSQVTAASRALHGEMDNPLFIDPLARSLAGMYIVGRWGACTDCQTVGLA